MQILIRRPRLALLVAGSLLSTGVSLANPTAPQAAVTTALPDSVDADISIMTYNVKGLPWPLASGRDAAMERIGERLAWMRSRGRQPDVVVLQEAFTDSAKAIGDRAGYRFKVLGAGAEQKPQGPAKARSWYLGETQGPQVDSGLVILSDLPIVDVRRAAFPTSACAGYDCLAAKGVVLVTLRTADGTRVSVGTTHLNSRRASGAPIPQTTLAYGEQATFLSHFIRDNWDGLSPLVLAGDFNLGKRPERLALLPPALHASDNLAPVDALNAFAPSAAGPDVAWIRKRARDIQFVFAGNGHSLHPIGLHVPFGSEPDGEPLSDHFGYTVDYRFTPRAD